jgi:hypothetical protein
MGSTQKASRWDVLLPTSHRILSVYASGLKNFRDKLLTGGVGMKHKDLEVVVKVRNEAETLVSLNYGIK